MEELSWHLLDMPDRGIEELCPVLRRHGVSVQVRCRNDGAIEEPPDEGQCIGLYSGMEESINPSLKNHEVLILGVTVTVDGKELVNIIQDLTVYEFAFEDSMEYLRRLLDHAIRVVTVKQLPYVM